MLIIRILALPLMVLFGVLAYSNVQLYQSTVLIQKSNKALEDFEFDQAIQLANSAIDHFPYNADAHLNLANINGVLWMFRKEKTYRDAMDQAYQKATSLNQVNAVYFYKWSSSYANPGDYQNALIYINKAIALDPNGGGYYYEKGIYLEALGKKQEALSAYQTSHDLSKLALVMKDIQRLKGSLENE